MSNTVYHQSNFDCNNTKIVLEENVYTRFLGMINLIGLNIELKIEKNYL